MGKKNTIKHAFLLFLSLVWIATSALLLSQRSSAASNYHVHAIIVIPANFKNQISDSTISTYQSSIIQGLQQAQNFYSAHLQGHTFTYDNSVEIAKLDANMDVSSNDLDKEIRSLGVGRFIAGNQPDGEDDIVFLIGSGNAASIGYSSSLQYASSHGLAVISEAALQDLVNGGTYGSDAITHELGHTFGLLYTNYSNGHPCANDPDSLTNAQGCTDAVRNGSLKPIPPASEWYTSVMGYGSIPLYPNTGLDNSSYNPEIQIIYKSRFINPNGDKPPPLEGVTTFDSMSPNPVNSGDTVILKGSNFGGNCQDTPQGASIELQNAGVATGNIPNVTIKSWCDNEIDFSVTTPDLITNWNVVVHTADGRQISAQSTLTVVASHVSVTANFAVTCQDGNSPKGTILAIQKEGDPSTELDAIADDQGKGTLNQDFFHPSTTDVYDISPKNLQNSTSIPAVINIPFSKVSPAAMYFEFKLSQCETPPSVSPSTSPSNAPSQAPVPSTGPSSEPSLPVATPTPSTLSGGQCVAELGRDLCYVGVCKPNTTCGFDTNCDISQSHWKVDCASFSYCKDASGNACQEGGKACAYTDPTDGKLHAGNCLDGSQSCSTDVNCGYVPGYSTGEVVTAAPSGNPTTTPARTISILKTLCSLLGMQKSNICN